MINSTGRKDNGRSLRNILIEAPTHRFGEWEHTIDGNPFSAPLSEMNLDSSATF